MYPKIKIDLNKIKANCKIVVDQCEEKGISVTAIMKSFCARPEIAEALVESGVKYLGDARLENLKRVSHINIEKILIRIPSKSAAKDVIKYSDISLNSELEVIKLLNQYAAEENKIHKIVLMVELGDLREGILEEDILDVVKEVQKLKNIKLFGIGVNLTCYGGVIPTPKNLGKLIEINEKIKMETGIELEMISGGNSSSYYLVQNGKLPIGINNLRMGETIVFGTESAYGERIKGTHNDVFTVEAEIIESKVKNSIPEGEIGFDAFGNKPVFEDLGKIKRAILSIGRQDTEFSGMIPLDENIQCLGCSSDHFILNVTGTDYKIGDIVKFRLNYSALLKLMTSEYVNKEYIN